MRMFRNERLHKLTTVNPACLVGTFKHQISLFTFSPPFFLLFLLLTFSSIFYIVSGDGRLQQASSDQFELILEWFNNYMIDTGECNEISEEAQVNNANRVKTGIFLSSYLPLTFPHYYVYYFLPAVFRFVYSIAVIHNGCMFLWVKYPIPALSYILLQIIYY